MQRVEKISLALVEQLSHSAEETRVEALIIISGKITTALQDGKDIIFQGVELIRALLNWFRQEVITQEGVVLQLIFLVLKSKYGPAIVTNLTKDFLRSRLHQIQRKLGQHQGMSVLLDNIMRVIEGPREIQREEVEITPGEYVRCWSTPNAIEIATLNQINSTPNLEDSQEALDLLVAKIDEYPPEFFLQPPYLMVKLQNMVAEGNILKRIICEFNEKLKVRLHESPSTSFAAENQMSVSKYCLDMFNAMGYQALRSKRGTIMKWCFDVLPQLVDLLTIDKHRMQSTVITILVRLGDLAEFYRKRSLGQRGQDNRTNMEDIMNRMFYMKFLQLIVELRKILIRGVEDKISSQVLSIARLDVPMKICYPEIYRVIEAACPRGGDTNIETLLNCEELIRPVVTLLRPLQRLTDEEKVMAGVDALKSIHLSTELAEQLIDCVVNCVSKFHENIMLRISGEKIVLQLLAHPFDEIKRVSYCRASEKMEYFVNNLVDAEHITAMGRFHGYNNFLNLGIPLTDDILNEITAFGCSNSDPIIQSSSTKMLLLILRSPVVPKDNWKTLPLLQCWASKSTELGKEILNLFSSSCDQTGLEVIQEAVRLLFSMNPAVRGEAVSRIGSIISSLPNSDEFLPRIDQAVPAVPKNFAICSFECDLEVRYTAPNSEHEASLENLLGILEVDSPSQVRKTTMEQINNLAADMNSKERLMDCDAWELILKIIYECLKVNQTRDDVGICVPAVQILTKLLLHCPQLRRDLSKNSQVYIILLRCLLMFQHIDDLKVDAVTALFLLAFSQDSVTAFGNSRISLPRFMEGKLRTPFIPQYHWMNSPHEISSPLEKILKNRDQSDFLWQFLRISWANVWFDGLENVMKNSRISREMGDRRILDFRRVPDGQEEFKTVKYISFDERLVVTEADLLLISNSLPTESFRCCSDQIHEAMNHAEVLHSMANMDIALNLQTQKLPMTGLCDIIGRFCVKVTHQEQYSTRHTKRVCQAIQLLRTMLDHDEDGGGRMWLIRFLQTDQSVIIDAFERKCVPPMRMLMECFRLVCKILEDFSHDSIPVLEIIIRMTLQESDRAMQEAVNIKKLQLLFQILTRCCSCAEWRTIMLRKSIVNRVSSLLDVSITRTIQFEEQQDQVTEEWLKLYDILTTYSECPTNPVIRQ